MLTRRLHPDLRHALRTMGRQRLLTAAILLTVAIGVGANTAVFSTLRAALLLPLPFTEPERLVLGRATFSGNINPMASAPDYYDYREQCEAFSSLAAALPFEIEATVTGGDTPQSVPVTLVSWDLFPTLGVDPMLGRHFSEQEGQPGALDVVMINHRYWQRRFGGSPDAVGSPLTINGTPHTVVGVMPAGFRFLTDADVWGAMQPGGAFASARRFHNWLMVGRLAPGVSLAQAEGRVDIISRQLEELYPDSNTNKALRLDPLQDALVEDHGPQLLLTMGAVGLLLLIACANVASLLLARASGRRSELAMRAALGASRWRLMRQLLVESLVLALTGGALGLVVARVLQRVLPAVTRLDELGIGALELDAGVLTFALGASVVAGVLFGIAPCLRAAPSDVASDLRGGPRSTLPGRSGRARGTMVVAQVGLCVMLLVGSGLLVRSFRRLATTDVGFDTTSLLTAEVKLASDEYSEPERRMAFFTTLLEEVRALPGVTAAAMISQLPLRNPGNNIYVHPEGRPPIDTGDARVAFTRIVMPGYFATMGIPITAGRDVSAHDTSDTPRVLVVNQTMASRLFPNENPVGQRVAVDLGGDAPVVHEVIGVVGDARLTAIGSEPRMAMYHSYYQRRAATMRLALRTAVPPETLTSALRETVWRHDSDIPVKEVVSMERLISDSVSHQRVIALTLSIFAGVAMLLAAIGLYGVLAYFVSQRTRELGIRMALGARPSKIVELILGKGLVLVVVGLVLGSGGALAGGRLLQRLLYQVEPTDPLTFAATALLLLSVAVTACLLPAVRAARVDPLIILRTE